MTEKLSERFAKAYRIRAYDRDDAGFGWKVELPNDDYNAVLAALRLAESPPSITEAVAAERERCAKIAEGVPTTKGFRKWPHWHPPGREPDDDFSEDCYVVKVALSIAAAIREKKG